METHVSTVFLVGDRAYKLKKPIATDFLDFSTMDRRRAACEREVTLNRRLAPDVYLGVAEIRDERSRPCDYLTVMKRLPRDRSLGRLVRAYVDVETCLRAVARAVAAFHSLARRSPEVDAEGALENVRRRWKANLRPMTAMNGVISSTDLTEISLLAYEYLDGRRPLFDGRIAEGKIVDGHGDLLADDVFCMPDGPRLLDCLEFDDRLRFVDVLDDISCLAMDLERLGRPDLAATFVKAYRDIAGESAPETLLHHYTAYRALVRAKVAAIRFQQGEMAKAAEAHDCLAVARRRLRAGRPTLVLVGGGPGAGKSTLSGQIAKARGWTLSRSDEIRKELAGLPTDAHTEPGFERGVYMPEFTDRTYAELLSRASSLLRLGECVVADATWSKEKHRRAARAVAEATSSRLVELRCDAPLDVRIQRINGRTRRDASDATASVAEHMAKEADPWQGARTVDTTRYIAVALSAALDAIDRELPRERRSRPTTSCPKIMGPDRRQGGN